MQELFGSTIRGKLLNILSSNSNITIKELSEKTEENYRSVCKILKELQKGGYVREFNNKYSLTSKFISLIITLQNNLLSNYHNDLFLEKKQNIYQLLKCFDDSYFLEKKISSILTTYLENKIHIWLQRWNDSEDKEFNSIKCAIDKTFSNNNNLSILEVGCNTGRITKKLSTTYNTIVSIDNNEHYINFCKKYYGEIAEFHNCSLYDLVVSHKFDVIIFSHDFYQHCRNHKELFEIFEYYKKNNTMVIILEEDEHSGYRELLELFRLKQESLFEKQQQRYGFIINRYNNFQTKSNSIEYQFDSISKVIEQIKIQLCLEEGYQWSVDDEDILKQYLLNKNNPLKIEKKVWLSSFQL